MAELGIETTFLDSNSLIFMEGDEQIIGEETVISDQPLIALQPVSYTHLTLPTILLV